MSNIIQFQPYLDRKRKQSVIIAEPVGILAEGEHIIKVSPCDIERMVLQNRIDYLGLTGLAKINKILANQIG